MTRASEIDASRFGGLCIARIEWSHGYITGALEIHYDVSLISLNCVETTGASPPDARQSRSVQQLQF